MKTNSIHYFLALIKSSWAFVGHLEKNCFIPENDQQHKNPQSLAALGVGMINIRSCIDRVPIGELEFCTYPTRFLSVRRNAVSHVRQAH